MSNSLAQGVRAGCVLAMWGWLASLTLAHVGLDSPNGGEQFVGGSDFSIQWHVEIRHSTLDWDLWYSAESKNGPWEEIALDLPAGDITVDAVHTFDWTLPNLDLSEAWVRVRQDNSGTDYFDVSDSSFSISAIKGGGDFTGDGNVDVADLTAWEQGFGTASAAAPADGDADLDADVDGADFLVWQRQFDGDTVDVVSRSVPEPAATVLLLVGMIIMLWWRR